MIKEQLVTVVGDPFGSDIKMCLGNVQCTRNGEAMRQCKNTASNKKGKQDAKDLMARFAAMNAVPQDEAFYEDVRRFIRLIHCTPKRNLKKKEPHAAAALRNFEDWKRERTVAHPRSTANLGTSTGDGLPVNLEVGTDASPSQPAPETPQRTASGSNLEADRQDSVPLSPSDTGLSPGYESVFDEVFASPATTAITTPGSLPPNDSPSTIAPDAFDFGVTAEESDPDDDSDFYSSDDEWEVADERPETPTPLSRNARPPPNPFARAGPFGTTSLPRRYTAIEKRHGHLLEAITSSFKKTEYKAGRVYVWKHKTISGVVKIGFTTRTIEKRRADSKNCYAKDTDEFWQSDEVFVGAYRVEKIIKRHLREWNVRLTICRRCGKAHREWFKKDADEVLALMEDWTRFARIAYPDGRLSEAGRHAVAARVLDMQPNVSELVAFLVSIPANATISVVREPASLIEGVDAGEGSRNTYRPVSAVVGAEQVPTAPELDSWSVVFEDSVSPRTIPPTAAPAKPKWRNIDWEGKAKAARCRLFGGHRSGRPEESGFPSASGGRNHPGAGQEKDSMIKDIFKDVMRRFEPELRKLEGETRTNRWEDPHALRERITSWMPRPRRAATFF